MNQTDKSKLIPQIHFIEKELSFLETYKKEIEQKGKNFITKCQKNST